MKTCCWLALMPFFLFACQSSGSNIRENPTSASLLEVKPTTPTPTLLATQLFVPTPSQTPIPPTPTYPSSLSPLRIAFTDEKNIWLWKDGAVTTLSTLEGYSPVKLFPAQYNYFVSPDFAKIAYVRLREELRKEIYISNIDGSEDIVYGPGSDMSITTWSPDSQYLVLISREEQYYAARIGDEPISLTELFSEGFLWMDEQYFLYKTFQNGACELRLGRMGSPSILLATVALDPNLGGCSRNPYDFVK